MNVPNKFFRDLLASPENLTDEALGEMRKDYRAQRVKNKAEENQNKKPLESPDVLDAEDFHFEPFEQERGSGDSGNLLIATHKTDTTQKYIVKHAFCDCAANEYVYCKIAQALGLKVPDVKLFRLSDPLDDTIFKTEYVVGIEYLNVVDIEPAKEQRDKAKNADDYYKFNTLYKLFYEQDSLEVVLANDGHLYRIDASAAFILEDNAFLTAGFEKTPDEYLTLTYMLSNKWNWDEMDRELKILIELFGDDKIEVLLSPLYDIQKIHKPYISKFLETLCYFYPDCVGEYYNFFFTELKKRVKSFVSAIERYQAAPYFK